LKTNELDEISNKIAKITKNIKNGLQKSFLEIGQQLNEARQLCFKQKLPFNNWIRDNTEISKSYAYRLIEIYQKRLTHPEFEFLNYSESWKTIQLEKVSKVSTKYTPDLPNNDNKSIILTPEEKEVTKIQELQRKLKKREDESICDKNDLRIVTKDLEIERQKNFQKEIHSSGCEKCARYENYLDQLEESLPPNLGNSIKNTRDQI